MRLRLGDDVARGHAVGDRPPAGRLALGERVAGTGAAGEDQKLHLIGAVELDRVTQPLLEHRRRLVARNRSAEDNRRIGAIRIRLARRKEDVAADPAKADDDGGGNSAGNANERRSKSVPLTQHGEIGAARLNRR